MTNKDIFKDISFHKIDNFGLYSLPTTISFNLMRISKNELTFFQGNVIKYVIRYPNKLV